jgi:phospholipid/cholesterol/gamma-HCH transport system substrate-binding protein
MSCRTSARTTRPGAARWTAITALAVACLLLASGCGWTGLQGVQLPGGPASQGHSYRVTVEFRDVLDLVPQSAVKVNGVTVGSVEKVELHGWTARVRVRISGSVNLPANAMAELGQTSLLGEKYVSLSAPYGVRPVGRLTDGAYIPLSRSGRNTEVEEVLSALAALLNGGGVGQLHTITAELNRALGGREDRVKDLLSQLDRFVGGLDAQRGDIVRALTGIDKLSATLAAQRGTITRAVDTIPGGLKALADERGKLSTMLTSLSHLGDVATKVINSSRDDTLANLRNLAPILTRLDAAGTDLPNALELLTTYPFPRNITGAIKGDYVNLDATADLDLAGIYGNLGSPAKPKPAPSKPGLPLPTVPSLPKTPGLPGLPKLPVPTPSVPKLPLPTPGPRSSGGSSGGILCPPVCMSAYTTYWSTAQDPPGIDLSLADLMTQGVWG